MSVDAVEENEELLIEFEFADSGKIATGESLRVLSLTDSVWLISAEYWHKTAASSNRSGQVESTDRRQRTVSK